MSFCLRQLHGHTQGHTAGDDGDLVQRVGRRKHDGTDSVAGLVVRNCFLFDVAERSGLTLLAHQDAVACGLEV